MLHVAQISSAYSKLPRTAHFSPERTNCYLPPSKSHWVLLTGYPWLTLGSKFLHFPLQPYVISSRGCKRSTRFIQQQLVFSGQHRTSKHNEVIHWPLICRFFLLCRFSPLCQNFLLCQISQPCQISLLCQISLFHNLQPAHQVPYNHKLHISHNRSLPQHFSTRLWILRHA